MAGRTRCLRCCTPSPSPAATPRQLPAAAEPTAPRSSTELDGGYGWVVVLGSFLCHFIADGIAYTFGVLVPALVEQFDSGRAAVGGVGSLMIGITWISGPLVSVVVNRFGYRTTSVAGAFMSAVGFLVSSFTPTLSLLYFSLSALAGFFLGCIYIPSVVIINLYFDRRRSLATGIAVCGAGAGTIAFAPFVEYLVTAYGWRGTLLIEAGLLLNCCVCGTLFVLPSAVVRRPRLPATDAAVDVGDVAASGLSEWQSSTVVCEQCARPQTETMPGQPDASASAADPADTAAAVSSPHASQHITESANPPPDADRTIKYSGSMVDYLAASRTSLYISSQQSVSERRASGRDGRTGQQTCCSRLRRYFDWTLLCDVAFVVFAVANLLACVCYGAPYVYLPDLGQFQVGLDSRSAAMLLLIIGIANTLVRIVIGFVADLPGVNRLLAFSVVLVICGVASTFVAYYNSYALLATYAALFGASSGILTCLVPVLLVDLFGVDRLTDSFGAIQCTSGVGLTLGTLVVGALFDYRRSYNDAFVFAGVPMILGGLLTLAIPRVLRRRQLPPAAQLEISTDGRQQTSEQN